MDGLADRAKAFRDAVGMFTGVVGQSHGQRRVRALDRRSGPVVHAVRAPEGDCPGRGPAGAPAHLPEALLSGNAAAEVGDRVYRPHLQLIGGRQFTSVVIADLPTGEQRTTVVSANYHDHGLWSVLDPDRRLLYHVGIGLDTAAYTWSEPRSAWPRRKVRTIDPYLLAAPVQLPVVRTYGPHVLTSSRPHVCPPDGPPHAICCLEHGTGSARLPPAWQPWCRSPDLVPFFSRRIGLFQETEIPVWVGGKLNGRVGATNVGALLTRTGRADTLQDAGLSVHRGLTTSRPARSCPVDARDAHESRYSARAGHHRARPARLAVQPVRDLDEEGVVPR